MKAIKSVILNKWLIRRKDKIKERAIYYKKANRNGFTKLGVSIIVSPDILVIRVNGIM